MPTILYSERPLYVADRNVQKYTTLGRNYRKLIKF